MQFGPIGGVPLAEYPSANSQRRMFNQLNQLLAGSDLAVAESFFWNPAESYETFSICQQPGFHFHNAEDEIGCLALPPMIDQFRGQAA